MAEGGCATAVVGVGCVLPDAASPSGFWSNALGGRSALRPLDGWRWGGRYHHPDPAVPDRSHCRAGAFITGYALDWRKYRISPASARLMNPMQLYALGAGTQALADVRHVPRERTGVFVGATGLGWKPDAGLSIRLADLLDAARRGRTLAALPADEREAILEEARAALAARLDPVTEDHGVNAGGSIAAGRIAMHLDLHGLHYAVDAGGASSLAALEMGVRSLRDGTVDLALVGGASELLTPLHLVAHAKLGVLAREELHLFDPESEGTLLGEGAVFFALKRLDDALEEGEPIHAVVRGVAGATGADAGARRFAGPDAQRSAMARAHADGGSTPDEIAFVECHAGGVPSSDADELLALAGFFSGRPRASVAVASSKPLVGDLGGGSGAVSLLSAVLALREGELPPQLGLRKAHPLLEGDDAPLFVVRERRAVPVPRGLDRARAGVNALGLGGSCFHAVVEAHVPAAARRTRARTPSPREPIAVVGLGAIVPGAPDAPAFWKSLLDGRDATREVPRSRWDIDRYFDPDPRRADRTYTRIGCFLDPVPPPEERWAIAAEEIPAVGPDDLIALRAAEEALADAGLDRDARHRSRTAVILGTIPVQARRFLADARIGFREFELELERALAARGIDGDRARAALAEAERSYKAALPEITEYTLPGFLGSVAAARIARRFELGGPHFATEAACSSTLAALHAAVQGLRERAFDVAVCGGVWADTPPEFLIAMSRIHGISASGITPFDARASGFLMGEGTGILVMQRLADAERDGRRIHGLIRAVAGTSDGRGRRSIFAPSPDGEADAMRRAIDDARIEPGDLDYIECHGTGTPIGDVAEIDACARTYGKARDRPLLVGSVKSNLGHLMSASGAPALVKAVLAVRDGIIPASLKFTEPNPRIDFSAGRVEVVTAATTWRTHDGRPRIAGVNSFGLGGTNFHAVVQQYVPAAEAAASRGAGATAREARRILPIAAASGSDLVACARMLGALARESRHASEAERLEAFLRTQEQARSGDGWRAAVVAPTSELLERRVSMLEREIERSGGDLAFLRQQGVFVARPDPALRVAALFPGQGPQYPGMLRDALGAFPEIGETLDAVDRAHERLCGRPLRPSFLAGPGGSTPAPDEDAHCAVFAVNVALFRLLRLHGLRVDAVAGQSAGELSALVAAGALTLEDGLAAVRERTQAVLALETPDPGRMVGLACGADRARALLPGLPGYAVIAADNGPAACIVSAETEAAKAVFGRAEAAGIRAEVLPVSHGYHSELIAGARPRYRAALEALRFRRPAVDVVSTITGASLRDLPVERFPEHLSSQFVEPVRFREAIETLHAAGTRLYLECGPKWPLTTFVGSILQEGRHVAQPSIHPKVGEVEQLHRALACLFVHGAGELHPMHDADRKIARPHRPVQPRSHAPAAARPATHGDLTALLAGIRDLIDGYLANAVAEGAVALATAPADAPSRAAVPCGLASPEEGLRDREGPVSAASLREQDLQRLLVQQFAARTGYPEDMLEMDLDLEADLGIDTVKQVAVLSAVRDQLGLAPDPAFRLRDAGTLRKLVDYLTRRLGAGVEPPPGDASDPVAAGPASFTASASTPRRANGESTPGSAPGAPGPSGPREPAAIPATRSVVLRMLVDELVKRTGYPEDMLELDLDLEADLGIDTVKQVAALAAVRDVLGLPADPRFRLREANTLRKVLDHFSLRLEGRDLPAGREAGQAQAARPGAEGGRADGSPPLAPPWSPLEAVRDGPRASYPREMALLDEQGRFGAEPGARRSVRLHEMTGLLGDGTRHAAAVRGASRVDVQPASRGSSAEPSTSRDPGEGRDS